MKGNSIIMLDERYWYYYVRWEVIVLLCQMRGIGIIMLDERYGYNFVKWKVMV